MDIPNEINEAVKSYLKAFFTKDFEAAYGMLYEEDVEDFRIQFLEMAEKMDEIGENEKLFARIGIENLDQLNSLSTKEFISIIFNLISREIGAKYLKKLMSDFVITNIDLTDYFTIVQYEYPIYLFDEWETMEGELQLIKSNGAWKFFFKSDLNESFNRFSEMIKQYNERKKRDNLAQISLDTELRPFYLMGYKDDNDGRVILEPRFADAGNFSEGLAYAKVLNTYGYINIKGDFVIKPKYVSAKDFSEGYAGVQCQSDDENEKWGFIDNMGNLIIEPQYDVVDSFSEGLCAIKMGSKWGYINKKGKLIIPFSFDCAGEFINKSALVEMTNEEGETIEMRINKKGEIIEF